MTSSLSSEYENNTHELATYKLIRACLTIGPVEMYKTIFVLRDCDFAGCRLRGHGVGSVGLTESASGANGAI